MHENMKGFLSSYQSVCRYLQQSRNFSMVKEIKEIHSATECKYFPLISALSYFFSTYTLTEVTLQ